MKRSLSARQSSNTVEQGSSKRQKTDIPHYSARVHIPWKEQKALGGDFKRVGANNWPISHISDQRGSGESLEYLVVWQTHPKTQEQFEPTWLSHLYVNDHDIDLWQKEKKKKKEKQQQDDLKDKRRARQQRIIPSSSGEALDPLQQSDAPSPPSLHTGSSDSELEIPETQYPTEPLVTVIVPSLPEHETKTDYALLESSQIGPSSPVSRVAITSSQSQADSETHRDRLRKSPRNETSNSSVSPSSTKSKQLRVKPRSSLGRTVVSTTDIPGLDKSHTDPTVATSPPSRRQSGKLGSPFSETLPSLPDLTQHKSSPPGPTLDRSDPTYSSISYETADSQIEVPVGPSLNQERQLGGTISNPLALNSDFVHCTMASRSFDLLDSPEKHTKSPLSQAISIDELAQDPPLFTDDMPDIDQGPSGIGTIPLIIQESIEDDLVNGTSNIVESKANSSQESLNNEREIETVDGVMIPALPVFGPSEYAIALPAEGKVKSAYDEIIKIKKKSILRFISRKGAPGTADISCKKTTERSEMQNMLQRLCDTTTHADLGLPATQHYDMSHEQNAAYAEYAGSKFTLLGYLIDHLETAISNAAPLSFVIFAQEGSLLDLLEEFLLMKKVAVYRGTASPCAELSSPLNGLSVELLATQSGKTPQLLQKPSFIIAFDVSFTSSDPQLLAMRQRFGDELPIIHLLVTNSAEHVERCVPASLTSNIRLKVVVRTTYLAAPYLGGEIVYIQDPSDQPSEDRPMDMSDLQRAVRKSLNRRMQLTADIVASLVVDGTLNEDWSFGGMPELKLAPLETPPKTSRATSRTPQSRRTRTQTPVSRATTPVGRKRLLDTDSENGIKRIRLTPVRDIEPPKPHTNTDELLQAKKEISLLTSEITTLRASLSSAEAKQTSAEQKANEWQESHSSLQRRYEKSRDKQREMSQENKALTTALTTMKDRDEAARTEKSNIRQQMIDLKAELSRAREEMKSAGGDTANLEAAREEARNATARALKLEKTAKSSTQDFEFLRTQYQDASKQAVDLAAEVRALETQIEALKIAAGDSKRALKAMNYEASLQTYADTAEAFSLQVKSRDAHIKRLSDEIASLKSRRGVQTRGSSVQPATSPAPRSRQASPAPGIHLMPPTGSRTSVLRNER